MTVLCGYALETSYGLAVMAPKKGVVEDAVKSVLEWLLEAGYENQKIELQSDGEPAITGLLREIARRRTAETLVRTSPPGHHQSQGGVERWVQTIQGTSRTFRLVLEEEMKKPVLASSTWGALRIRRGM